MAYPDLDVRGLELRVSAEGRKVWTFRYRNEDGQQKRLTLGLWAPGDDDGPARANMDEGPRPLTLKEARRVARIARANVDAGKDPAGDKRIAKAEARAEPVKTFGDLIEAYLTACEKGHWKPRRKVKGARSIADERGAYNRYLKVELGDKRLETITRPLIRETLEKLTERGIGAQANKAQALIRQAFNYAISRDRVTVNPAVGIATVAPINRRDRVLSDAELSALWSALKDPSGLKSPEGEPVYLGRPMAIVLQLCALLLLRRSEVVGMRDSELTLDQTLWLIPGERMKNRQPHLVPLPPRAVALIREAQALAEAKPVPEGERRPNNAPVFPGLHDPSKSMRPDSVTHAMRGLTQALGIADASPHDLRRTGSTALTSERLQVSPFIRSLILSHTTDSGGGSAVSSAHYDANSYASEKRAALTAWEGLLLEIVGERPGLTNVTRLPAAVRARARGAT